MASIDGRTMFWTFFLASSHFFLSFSVTSNILVSLTCSVFISPFAYVTIRDLMKFIAELMGRLTDYESLNLFTIKFLSSLDERRNIISILEDIYKSSNHKSESLLKMKNVIKKTLYQRVFKHKRLQGQDVKFSSPTSKFLISLIEKLDFIDEFSLRTFLISLRDLSSYLRLNAKKLKDFIVAEKVKYKVLQIASSMTLGFMIKTFSIFMSFSFSSTSPSLLILASFTLLSMIFFIVFPSIIRLHPPSFKDLVLCFFTLLAFMTLPPYGGA